MSQPFGDPLSDNSLEYNELEAVEPRTILWDPHPGPQQALINSNVYEVLYGGSRGGGKLSPIDSKVLTPTGWVLLGDLKIGSKLCATDGTVTEVIGIFPQGKVQNYRVSFHDGTSLECGLDHNWLGWRVNKSVKLGNEKTSGEDSAQKWTTREIIEIIENDNRLGKKKDGTRRFAIPICDPVAFNVAGSLMGRGNFLKREIDPYLLGLLLGDGSLGASLRISSEDQEIIDYLKYQAGADLREDTREGNAAKDLRLVGVYGSRLKLQLDTLGLMGTHSNDKFIPRIYLLGSVEERWALLQGLMDTDGWAEEKRSCYYTTVSTRLRDDVTHLARSLGAIVTITEKKPKYTYKGEKKNGQIAYCLRIKVRQPEKCFRLTRKQEIAKTIQYQSFAKYIQSIEPTREVESLCISVRHRNSLYIADDFIVTHNTDSMLADFAKHGSLYGAAARGIFFRKTLPRLEDTIRRSKELYTMLGAIYRDNKKTWFFPNGATLRFKYLERDKDAENYQGQSYTWICFEEMTQWANSEPIDKIRACLRSAEGVPCYFRATANPGGPGHGWVKTRYITPAPLGYKILRETETGLERCYIPARLEHNPSIDKKDPNYRNRLKSLGNPALVEAWLNGNWDIADGGYWDGVWSPEKHISKRFKIPASWSLSTSFDWGYAKPASFSVWAESNGTHQPEGAKMYLPTGTIVRVAEWYTVKRNDLGYAEPDKGMLLTNEKLGEMIWSNILKPIEKRVEFGVADPSIFSQDKQSIYAQMKAGAEKVGGRLSFRKSDNSRIPGWLELLNRLTATLEDDRERPGFITFDTCENFIRTFPILPRDGKDGNDIDSKAEDHAGDDARYRAMARRGGMNVTQINA